MSLQHTLLGLLDWAPLHGYRLREWARSYSWIYPMTNANIYPTLGKLERAGLVEHTAETHRGRKRKVYRTTQNGRDELRRWLADDEMSRGSHIDPILLKISLLRGDAIPAARSWIEREIAEAEADRANAMGDLEKRGQHMSRYGRLVLEHGRDQAQLRTTWLREVLLEIEADTRPPLGVNAVPEQRAGAA